MKGVMANKAVAAILGFNEHSLAAAINTGPGVELAFESNESLKSERPKCEVPDCDQDTDYEVRLYDIYLNLPFSDYSKSEMFDEQDFTCPFICAATCTKMKVRQMVNAALKVR